ncbi:quinic acid utilization activator [Pyrenochaeta sp. MPI-SDFR-AT-0127]|nr:quinic acid utilization activator [Pyrenochaeta sp. MPI-SDFR-AT-0127]
MPCFELKRSCTYTSNPRKRGLQPGYIRSLETTLAFVFQQSSEIEALVNKQLAQENTVLLARGTKESNQLHKSWRKSRFCRDVTKALSGEQINIKEDRLPSSDDESEVDVEDASILQTLPSAQLQVETPWAGDSSLIPHNLEVPSLPDRRRPIPQQSVLSPQLTPLPADCWKLLETYSSYTQSWLPICEKLDILKLSYSYPEEGLALSHDMPDSGHHAEMWSIFAVGCTHDSSYVTGNPEAHRILNPRKLYEISRLLIPSELGKFDLNHVKALLNLAVFNIKRSLLDSAWLLVGAASRIFLTINTMSEVASPRRKIVFASCFLLDSLLALHLKRRPYLDKSDLAWVGKIEEDGMEEWQPWGGELNREMVSQSRLPTLALSSFNNLLEIVDILVSTTQQPTARNFLHEMIGRLEMWKSSLPPKLDYIRSDSASTPLTPPAVLLQLTYLATAFALVPSQAWLQRILELLEVLRTQLGFAKLPSIVICLLQSIKRCSASLNIDQVTRARMQKLFASFDQACSIVSEENLAYPQSTPNAIVGTSPGVTYVRNREVAPISPQSFTSHIGKPISERYQPPLGASSLLDDLLPDMNPNRQEHPLQSLTSHSFGLPANGPAIEAPTFDSHDPYSAFVSGDLESFFDELASLHGAKKLQNQPQFMQNLGFSSEASMADLLAADPGRFMPLPSSNLGQENNGESPHFSLNNFYDTG